MELACPKVEHLPQDLEKHQNDGIYCMNSYRKLAILETLNRCPTLEQANFMNF